MANLSVLSLDAYKEYFVSEIPRTPTNRYASIILLRETKSYSIFTTETGEQQDVEQTQAGLTHKGNVTRLVMFKRKQVAPERRTGKALLRQYVLPFARFKKDKDITIVSFGDEGIGEEIGKQRPSKTSMLPKGNEVPEKISQAIRAIRNGNTKVGAEIVLDCYLTAGLCTYCPDCLIYGYAAVEGEGARKSRVLTDSCFSVRPYELIQKRVNFNVIDEATHKSSTLTTFDYAVPSLFLPAVVTTVDLTREEFVYVLSNVLRTQRYGKEVSRQGVMRNHVLAIAFSDVELFANLEFSQAFYDAFAEDETIDLVSGSLTLGDFQRHTREVIKGLTGEVMGRMDLVNSEKLEAILADVRKLNQEATRLSGFLRDLTEHSASFTV